MTDVSRARRRPLPDRVYWVRRLVVLGVALGLVFGIAQLLGTGGDTGMAGGRDADQTGSVVTQQQPQPGASRPVGTQTAKPDREPERKPDKPRPSRKPKKDRGPKPLAEPSGPCDSEDVVVTPRVVGTAYAGGLVRFELDLTTVETPACTWTASSTSLVVKLTSGDDRIWSSQDCPDVVATEPVVVRARVPATVDLAWRGQRSDADCSNTTEWVEAGWYHIEAAAYGAEPTDVQFELEDPVPATITAEPRHTSQKQKGASRQD